MVRRSPPWLISLLVLLLSVGSVGGRMADAYSPSGGQQAGERMGQLGIVQGKEGGDLSLNATITRAEFVTMLVRAFGQGPMAAMLMGSSSYQDTQHHWASGHIAVAKKMVEARGGSMGTSPSSFEPDRELTTAEAVAFTMKFLGIKPAQNLSWPMNYMEAAAAAGILLPAEGAAIADGSAKATRGVAFHVADTALFTYRLEDGKTVYQKHLPPPPLRLDVEALPTSTEAATVTVAGKVSGHTALFVNGVPIAAADDGAWSASVILRVGPNTITVTALDPAENATDRSLQITRQPGPPVQILVPPSVTLLVGSSMGLFGLARVVDQEGNPIPDAALSWSGGDLARIDGGRLLAGTRAGTGSLTVSSGSLSAAISLTVTPGPLAILEASTTQAAPGQGVSITARDEHGNRIAATFSADSSDASVDHASGSFVASRPGSYTVTASAAGRSASVTILVESPNRRPTVPSMPNHTGVTGASVHLAVPAHDPDGDTLTFSALFSASVSLSIHPTTGVITGTLPLLPATGDPTSFTVTVTATDPDGLSHSTPFTWSVTAPDTGGG